MSLRVCECSDGQNICERARRARMRERERDRESEREREVEGEGEKVIEGGRERGALSE